MKNIFMISLIAVVVSACAAQSSGVQQIGQDTYTVTVSNQGLKLAGSDYSARTRSKAISDANEFCQSRGDNYADVFRENVVRSETATTVIYFRCSK